MLEFRNIHKSFGGVRVLNGVNFCLEKGFVYMLKGGNGSVKEISDHILQMEKWDVVLFCEDNNSSKSTILKTTYALLKLWGN